MSPNDRTDMADTPDKADKAGRPFIIECRDVHKSFMIRLEHPTFGQRLHRERRAKEVLKGIDVAVREGEVFALLGSSGSGKSTLLRCINHLEIPDSGEIVVNGREMGMQSINGVNMPARTSELASQRSEIAMVFQHFNLFANKNVIGNVMMPLRDIRGLGRDEAREAAVASLGRVGIAEELFNMYPDRLSGGQQQRVAIARALAMKPHAILFDEPTSALDPELVGEVLQVIRRIADEGTTMMIVTHEMAFARGIADQIIVMDDGRIVEQGPARSVFDNPQSDKMKALLKEI
ncbi:amino acid ABC transporter ATP-binding protein [Bifidobacterium tibiigranuli]|uniref:amino acid ABC transporter ATP-binding protein n=2 Tax=Bifidobacterium TaxID=1678 RepID=UPI0023533DA6|nr:amino acid ABC transporter ATP-binding protein [Bifidobacterium tibiigranuli]